MANVWLEGTYSEVYPSVSRDLAGMARLFRQFSFPGGIPSHVAPETPGSIHEGGELGYSLSHAYGAVLDNPGLVAACVIGDGEAETGPLATAWHSNKFLDPAGDGAVLPILHLNGYKIANPTVLARIGDDELSALLTGYGYRPYLVEGDDPATVHQRLAATLDECFDRDRRDPAARPGGGLDRASTVADDRAADAEGLDRPEGGRRRPGRGHLARAPGAAHGRPRRRGPPRGARRLDALVPAGGALRRRRCARSTSCCRRAGGRPADGREPARQRWTPHPCPGAARLPRPTRSRSPSPAHGAPSRPGCSAAGCAT